MLVDELSELHTVAYNADQQNLPLKQTALNSYQLWLTSNPCYPNRPYPGFANLFLYNALTLD